MPLPWTRRVLAHLGAWVVDILAPEQHYEEAQPCQPDHKQTWVDNLWGIDDERFNDMMTMMMMEIMKIEGARVQRPLPMIASVQLSIVWQSSDFFRSRDPSPRYLLPPVALLLLQNILLLFSAHSLPKLASSPVAIIADRPEGSFPLFHLKHFYYTLHQSCLKKTCVNLKQAKK